VADHVDYANQSNLSYSDEHVGYISWASGGLIRVAGAKVSFATRVAYFYPLDYDIIGLRS
jgi:hypothetical protein